MVGYKLNYKEMSIYRTLYKSITVAKALKALLFIHRDCTFFLRVGYSLIYKTIRL